MSYKSQQSPHHPFVSLGRMACDGKGMIVVILPIHVGDLQLGFKNGCLQGHGVTLIGELNSKSVMLWEEKNIRFGLKPILNRYKTDILAKFTWKDHQKSC